MSGALRRRASRLARAAAVLLAALAAMGAAPPDSEPCTASGDAPVVKRDRVRAKARAIDAALARCAEDVVMRLLEDGRAGSGLSPADRGRAIGALRPQLAQEPGRLFFGYKVKSDRAQSGWVKVELTATARLRLLLDLARAAALNLSRGRAVVGVLVHESTERGPRHDIHGEPLSGGQLARLLHDRGYEVLPVPFTPGTEIAMLDDVRALAARAREARVELLVAGEVVVTEETGKTLARTRAVAIDGMFQVVEAETGKLRGRVPMRAQAEGSTPMRALRQALEGGLLAAVFAGVEPLLAVDGARASSTARVLSLRFKGFERFRDARQILEVAKLVPGVAAVDERDYYEGLLDFELEWAGSVTELEIELTTEMSRHRALADFRVVERGADRLVFAR